MPLRVFLSLVFALLSFVLFYLATYHALIPFSTFLFLIIAGNLFLGMGELFIGPALMSVVAHFINKNYQGTFMGLWSLSIAFSGFVGGLIAQISANDEIPLSAIYTPYLYTFKLVALIMLVVTVAFLILLPWLRRLTN